MEKRLTLVLAPLVALAAGLWTGGPADRPSETTAPRPVHYSPFVVDVPGAGHYDVISFKDVGMSLPDDERHATYEALAESVRHALGEHAGTRHDEGAADPSQHLSCEGRHVYVDLWHQASSDTWGYSLWSGCGEDDRFALETVERPRADRLAELAPLARSIAASLQRAHETSCFQRRC